MKQLEVSQLSKKATDDFYGKKGFIQKLNMENTDYLRMKRCPRFHKCSAPICPLDIDKDKRIRISGEPVCELGKTRRMKLGYDLPWKGLTSKELAGKRSWEAKSEKEKEECISKVAKLGKITQFARRIQKDNLKDSTKHINAIDSKFTVSNLNKKHETK